MTYAVRHRRHSRPMRIIILGTGIVGISTALHLFEQGHEVTVVDRQPDAAMEPALPTRHKSR